MQVMYREVSAISVEGTDITVQLWGAGSTAKVLARGLGALTPAQQLEQLMEWLAAMASQLAGADGKTEAERQEELRRQNEAVLSV